ncbi:MAG: phosphodiester glycosidase family protein [Clostridia bacterium]
MSKKDGLLRVWQLIVIDVLLIGVGLVIFSYFHHVREVPIKPIASATPRITVSPNPNNTGVLPTVSIDLEVSPSPDQSSWKAKFPDKFLASGETPIITADSYQSENINIKLTRYDVNGIVYFVQDIYIADIANISTAMSKDTYGTGIRQEPLEMANNHNAIGAITGDYFGGRKEGPVARNGVLYRDVPYRDVCVLYYDGTMKTFAKDNFDAGTEMSNGAYQIWSFGPMLLDENGETMTTFDSDVPSANPRSAIGYAEPGHYYFVVVDGRERDVPYSLGMTLPQLSELFHTLGCKVAYNFDGGQTSEMMFGGKLSNIPPDGGRKMSDIVLISEIG